MSRSKLVGIAVITVLLLSLSVSVVAAQYSTEETTPVVISSNGNSVIITDGLGVVYDFQGVGGASGSVTTAHYNGNPQVTADIPSGHTLTHFIVVTFNMNAADFGHAHITIPYTDADVQGIELPFTIFKYIPDTNSYVELVSTTDTIAKTITVTVNSIADPLFAVSGHTTAIAVTSGVPTYVWVVLAGFVIAIVLIAGLLVSRLRRPDEGSKFSAKL